MRRFLAWVLSYIPATELAREADQIRRERELEDLDLGFQEPLCTAEDRREFAEKYVVDGPELTLAHLDHDSRRWYLPSDRSTA